MALIMAPVVLPAIAPVVTTIVARRDVASMAFIVPVMAPVSAMNVVSRVVSVSTMNIMRVAR